MLLPLASDSGSAAASPLAPAATVATRALLLRLGPPTLKLPVVLMPVELTRPRRRPEQPAAAHQYPGASLPSHLRRK